MDFSETLIPEKPKLDVSVTQKAVSPVPNDIAELRAVKYDFALGDTSPGLAKVKSLIQSPGGEDQLREQAKRDEEQKRWDAGVELFKSGEATESAQTLQDIVTASNRRIGTDSVLERKYAEKTLALSLSLTENPTEVNQAAESAPVMSGALYDVYVENLTRRESDLKLLEDAEADYQNSVRMNFYDRGKAPETSGYGWGGYAYDTAQSIVPFRTWAIMRNDALGEKLSAWLPGSNLEEQYAYLRNMKPEDGAILKRKIYNEIKKSSMVDARNWAQGVIEYNSGGIDDAFGVFDILSVTPIGLARKGAAAGLRKGASALSSRAALRKAREDLGDFNRVLATRLPEDSKKAVEVTLGALEAKRARLVEEYTLKVRSGNQMQAAVVRSVLEKTTEDVNTLRSGLEEISRAGKDAAGPLLERIRRTAISASDKHLDLPKILSSSGHIKEAAKIRARELIEEMSPKSSKTMKRDLAEAAENTTSLHSPRDFITDAATFHTTRASRIADYWAANKEDLIRAVNVINTSTAPAEAESLALDLAEKGIRDQYRNLKDSVLFAVEKYHSKDEPLTNAAYIEVVFGKTDGTLFKNAQSALNTGKNRYGMDISEKDIFQEGDGYAIRIRKDIDETSDEVRDSLITLNNKSNTERNKLFGFIPLPKALPGAKDSVSKVQAGERAITTHAVTARETFYAKIMESARSLSSREREDLKTIFTINRDLPGPDGKRGFYYKSVFELEQAYAEKFSRLPTDAEVATYQSFVQAMDSQYLELAASQLKKKARQGVERVTADIGKGEFSFEGRAMDYVPFDSKHIASVFYKPSAASKGKYYRLSEIRADDQKDINKQLKEGSLQVVMVSNPEDDVVREALGVAGPTNFVVLPSMKRGPLDLVEQVGYRPGGHVKYADALFVKQAKIYTDSTGRKVYGGDVVALGVSNTEKGAREVTLLERARKAVKAKDDSLLQKVLDDGLPGTIDEVKGWFKTRFNLDSPFALVKSGQSVADADVITGTGKSLVNEIGHFDNYVNSPFNLSKQSTDEFLAHKDGPLYSIKNSGTEEKPVWEMSEARTIDPFDTMSQTMSKLIRSKHFDAYKITSVESFIQEFGVQKGLIHINGKAATPDELRRNPGWAMANGEIVGVGKEAATAKNIQRAIRNLTQHRSLLSNHISQFQANILASAYKRSGEKYIDIIDSWSAVFGSKGGGIRDRAGALAYKVSKTDIPQKLRNFAFHTKLGLGNPVQIALQAQTLNNISFISPKHGPSATLISSGMKFLGLTPDDQGVIKAMGEKMAKITPGWTAENFVESHNLMKKTGFDLVGGDLSWRNDVSDYRLFTGKAVRLLDWSAGFFTHTERFVRIASWNTAYKEYLEKFPRMAGKLDADDAKVILSRAQDLSGNMTRDSHAFWQEGAASSVTQFWGYTGRMFDLLTGMRLTPGEKARLLTGWSVIYGLPTAGTALAPVWPWRDEVREMLLKHEVNPDEGLVGLIMNGAISQTVSLITGKHLDVAERYGPGAIPLLRTITDTPYGETTFDDITAIGMGASGSIIGDVIKDTYPIIGDLQQLVTDGDTSTLLEDANDLFSNVSTYNQAEQALAMIRTGMHLTKDERVVSKDHKTSEAMTKLLLGLGTTEGPNARAMDRLVRAEQSLQTKARRDAKEYIRLYFQSKSNKDEEQAMVYIKRARALMIGAGLTEKQIIDTVQQTRTEKSILDMSTDRYIGAGKTIEQKIQRQEVIQ